MGNSKSKNLSQSDKYKIIGNHFDSYNDLEKALRKVGLESSQLIVGIDFTRC